MPLLAARRVDLQSDSSALYAVPELGWIRLFKRYASMLHAVASAFVLLIAPRKRPCVSWFTRLSQDTVSARIARSRAFDGSGIAAGISKLVLPRWRRCELTH